jgi:hypothetical protein
MKFVYSQFKPPTILKWCANLMATAVVLLMGVSSQSALGQVSQLLNPTYGYTFSNTTTTYTPLSGGTVFQSGATLNTDGVSAAITLPSTFTYNGIKENTIFISNNGFITFALAPTTTQYSPISSTTSSGYDGVIAGAAMNCVASTASGAAPEIRYGSSGSDFVVQFQDIGQSGFSAIRLTFQIVLKADGKTVQIVYGPNNVGVASAGQCQVGLRGTNDEDWNNRTLASGGNWNTAGGAAGTANTSAMTLTATSTLPTSGRTFQWSPTAYTPTYLVNPAGVAQDFTTWVNGAGPANVPSTNWATNGYGNASWQIDNTTASTTGSGWTSTSGAYSPVDYLSAVGGRSARFHSYQSNFPQVGYLDYYVDMSTITGTPTLDFFQINPSGTDILQVFLSTNGGTTFTQIGANIGVATVWTARSISLGATNSATTIIRFKATSDFGNDGMGIDRVVITPPPAAPTVSSFTPNTNLCINGGQTVTITGTNFTGTTAVTFNGVNAASFSVVNGTTITAVTPAALGAGVITVTNPVNSANSAAYTVIANPTAAISPTSAAVCGGTPVALTASGGTTYAWSPTTGLDVSNAAAVNASPSSTTTYTVTVTDLGCTSTANVAVTVTPAVSATASATPPAVCAGGNTQLNVAVVQSGQSVIGAGASTSSSTAASFFPGGWGGAKTQYIVLGSELIAQGLKAGNITALAFEPTTAGQTYQGFFVNIGATAQSAMTTTFITTGLTEVYAGTLTDNGFLPVANTVNTLTFGTGGTASAFNWNGSSNIVVSISWSRVPAASTSTSSTMKVDAPGFTCSAYDQTDLATPAAEKATTTADGTGTSRPKFTFTGSFLTSPTYAWSESPAGSTLAATNIANPMANGISGTTIYTVTVTGNGGCTATSSVTVSAGAALTATPTATPATICAGASSTIAAVAAGGGAPYTYVWDNGAGTGATATVSPSSTTTYNVTVTDACLATATGSITVTVNPLPTATAGSNSPVCVGADLNLTATTDIGTTFAWAGPNTFTASTQNPSITGATLAATGTYTVTVTAAGCSATATTAVVVNETPVITSVTATPATLCTGGNSQLNAVASISPYSVSSTTYGLITPVSPVTLSTLGDDNNATVTMPFAFNFFGSSYSTAYVHSNGFVSFTSAQPTGSPYNETIPTAATPNNYIALCHDDLNVTGGGTVTHFTSGTSPNQIWVIQYTNVKFYNTAANSGVVSGQIQLFENGNRIEIHLTEITDPVASAHAVGIENSTGTVGFSPAGRNNNSPNWSIASASPEAYRFTPNTLTYAWSPATFLSATNIANPMATALTATTTYTVTVTGNGGCATTSSVTVTVNSTTAGITNNTGSTELTCTTTSISVTATGGTTYAWSGGATPATAANSFTAAGTYTVTVTDSNGCSSTAAITITSDTTPPTASGYLKQTLVPLTCITRYGYCNSKWW